MAAAVYLVTNRANGMRYVGITSFTVEKRWKEHIAKSAWRPKSWLHRAIAKYGASEFDVQQVASCLSVESARDVERDVIASFKPEYNQTAGGEFTVGRRISPEVVAKISASNRGKKRTAEQNKANSERKIALYANADFREASINRLKAAALLVNQEKRIAAVSLACSSRVWTDESRAKLSASLTGRKQSEKTIQKISLTKNKPVECINLNATFDSVSDAAESTGLSISGVSAVCIGRRTSANGLYFRFA